MKSQAVLAGWTGSGHSWNPADIPFMICPGFNWTDGRPPRFNVPFEWGLAVGYHTRHPNREHTWFVFETRPWRLQKSLSDLNGTDVYTHGGTPAGVFRELLTAFVRHHNQPTVRQMIVIFEALRKNLRPILQETGAASPFEASVFRRLSVYASALADELVKQ